MTLQEIAKKLQDSYTLNQIEYIMIKVFLHSKHIDTASIKNQFLNQYLRSNNMDIPYYVYNIDWTLKEIESLFELLIDPNIKKTQGVVFTPKYIVDYIINSTFDSSLSHDSKIADISCGCGAFLLRSTEIIKQRFKKPIIDTIENNIYGFDINLNSIRQTKILMTLLAISNKEDQEHIKFHLYIANTLKDNLDQLSQDRYDFIIGNPPYINTHDLDKSDITQLKNNYQTTRKGTFNIFYAFIEKGMQLLNVNGKLGYIIPNNFLTISSAQPLREYLQYNKYIEKMVDFDSNVIFNPVKTYNAIVVLSNLNKKSFRFSKIPHTKDIEENLNAAEFIDIQYTDLDPKSWHLLSRQEQINIKRIENNGIQIGTFIKTGIATLSDKFYMIDRRKKDDSFYYKEYKSSLFPIEKSIVRKLTKISNCNTEKEIKEHSLGIIFPYTLSNNTASVIDELTLGSEYPYTYLYFQAIRHELKNRDKGQPNSSVWYAYGRSQSLNLMGDRLLFPTFTKYPRFLKENDNNALFCNGYALFLEDGLFVKYKNIIQKVLNSCIMKYYIDKTSYCIEGSFRCYQKKFVKEFSIPYFDKNEVELLESLSNPREIDAFLIDKYNLIL